MTKKVYNLIVGIVGGLSTIAIAVVTFINPAFYEQLQSMLQSVLGLRQYVRFAPSLLNQNRRSTAIRGGLLWKYAEVPH